MRQLTAVRRGNGGKVEKPNSRTKLKSRKHSIKVVPKLIRNEKKKKKVLKVLKFSHEEFWKFGMMTNESVWVCSSDSETSDWSIGFGCQADVSLMLRSSAFALSVFNRP